MSSVCHNPFLSSFMTQYQLCNKSNTCEAGTAYLSAAPEFTANFQQGVSVQCFVEHCLSFFLVFFAIVLSLDMRLLVTLWYLQTLRREYLKPFSTLSIYLFSGGQFNFRKSPTCRKSLTFFVTYCHVLLCQGYKCCPFLRFFLLDFGMIGSVVFCS